MDYLKIWYDNLRMIRIKIRFDKIVVSPNSIEIVVINQSRDS